MTDAPAGDEHPMKEYVGYIWIGDDPGIRLSVAAVDAAEAWTADHN